MKLISFSEEGYTLFVPRDDAFWRIMVKNANSPDPFMLNEDFRREVLVNHLVNGRLFHKDMIENKILTTAGNKTLTVNKKSGKRM